MIMITKRIQTTKLYRRIKQAEKQIIVNVGGAGASKTYSLIQFFNFERLLKRKNYKLLILRKIRHSNKLSVYKYWMDLLKAYGLYNNNNDNKSDLVYTFPDLQNYIRFAGLEDRDQIKSTDWNDICFEEANEAEREDLLFLKTRLLRGELKKNEKPRIWCNLNPIDCWLLDQEGQPDYEFIHSTYKDNQFVNEEYKQTLESLKNEDLTYYNIYALGLRGIAQDIIYKPYTVLNEFPVNFQETIAGLDFGFNNPTSLLEVNLKDKEFYLRELIYQTKLTNQDLIELLKELLKEKAIDTDLPIYADCAEPQRIKEICDAGFNCLSSDKSVKDGLDFCKRAKYYTLPTNTNLNQEAKFYKYKTDRITGKAIDEPVKFRDHLMDCKRYAIYTHYKDTEIGESLRFKNLLKSIESRPVRESVNPDW